LWRISLLTHSNLVTIDLLASTTLPCFLGSLARRGGDNSSAVRVVSLLFVLAATPFLTVRDPLISSNIQLVFDNGTV
jgi:hypothetical protein